MFSETSKIGCIPIKKRTFCEKHKNNEIRAVCKDWNKLLCLVCKITDHEKHDSTDIDDEAETLKVELTVNIATANLTLSKLDRMLEDLSIMKKEGYKTKEAKLKQIQDATIKLKQFIDMRAQEFDSGVSNQYDNINADITSSWSNTKKLTTSLRNITMYASKMMGVPDSVSLVHHSKQLQKSLNICVKQADNYVSKTRCQMRELTLLSDCTTNEFCLNKILQIVAVKQIYKRLRKIAVCPYSEDVSSNEVCSLSIGLEFNGLSFTDTNNLCIISTPGLKLKKPHEATDKVSLFLEDTRCFFSITGKKEVNVWSSVLKTDVNIHKSDMYPHGIAYRNKSREELLVCLLENDTDMMSTKISKGVVRVLPLTAGEEVYEFLPAMSPAPTRIALNKTSGFVCLSYPSIGKVAIHAECGALLTYFSGEGYGESARFRPFGICFGNEGDLIIADRDQGQVLRVDLFGKLIQVLLEGNKPTAVGVDYEDRLWVGYEDISVTVYRLSDTA